MKFKIREGNVRFNDLILQVYKQMCPFNTLPNNTF